MSKGCLGYIASAVTLPPSLVTSATCPSQMRTSLPGCALTLVPHRLSLPVNQPLASPLLWSPPTWLTPQTVPLRSPERLPVPAGAAKLSQNAAVVPAGAERNRQPVAADPPDPPGPDPVGKSLAVAVGCGAVAAGRRGAAPHRAAVPEAALG